MRIASDKQGWRLAVDVSGGYGPVGRVSQSRDSGDGGATVTLQDGLVLEWLGDLVLGVTAGCVAAQQPGTGDPSSGNVGPSSLFICLLGL